MCLKICLRAWIYGASQKLNFFIWHLIKFYYSTNYVQWHKFNEICIQCQDSKLIFSCWNWQFSVWPISSSPTLLANFNKKSNPTYFSFLKNLQKNKSCHTSNWKSFVVLGFFAFFVFFFDINNHQQNVTLGLEQKAERNTKRMSQSAKKWKIGQQLQLFFSEGVKGIW